MVDFLFIPKLNIVVISRHRPSKVSIRITNIHSVN